MKINMIVTKGASVAIRELIRTNRSTFVTEVLESRTLLTITTSLIEVPIPQGAINEMPQLSKFRSYDLRINVPADDSFNVAGLRVSLTRGKFFQHTLGGDAAVPPALAQVFPSLAFDTAVSAPFDAAVGFLMPGIGGMRPMTESYVNVDWSAGPGIHSGGGWFKIARLTLSDDAVGTVQVLVYGFATAPSHPPPFRFAQTIPPSTIPPASISGPVFHRISNGMGQLPCMEVFADLDRDGQFEAGEPISKTNGRTAGLLANSDYFDYQLTLPPGTYDIRPKLTANESIYPGTPAVRTLTVSSGEQLIQQRFDIQFQNEGWVYGFVKNSSTIIFPDGHVLSGITVFVDLNDNNVLDSAEPRAITDDGYYLIKGVGVGTHRVRCVLPEGWYCDPSVSTNYLVDFASGVNRGVNFYLTRSSAFARSPIGSVAMSRPATHAIDVISSITRFSEGEVQLAGG